MLRYYKFLILISFMFLFDGKYAPTRKKHDFEEQTYNFEALILVIHGLKWDYGSIPKEVAITNLCSFRTPSPQVSTRTPSLAQ